ncbi:MAG: Na+/H+ antiporter NhaC family protein [Gemmatimonadetes bacterium]|nr:Na+/H+ antiporter NhaC family protein [Gemmatimonadota bacterium]
MEIAVEPGWLTLLPPLIAIVIALIFREVIVSLFFGIWLGALILNDWNPLTATLRSVDQFVVGSVADDADKIAIMVFSLLLGGLVGIMSRNGGTRGIVEAMRPLATSPRRGQFFTWLAGMVIFFDDYANTLIVGNTMRPVTDRLRVSREKLAYIVDSTAAPIAAIAVISTWVGFEITLIGEALQTSAAQTTDPALAQQLLGANPFNVFLHSIPYLFYPIFAIIFVVMTVLTRRDFGPMLKAETRARTTGELLGPGAMPAADVSGGALEPDAGTPHRWYYAGVPVLVVIAVALIGIYSTGLASLEPGQQRSLSNIVGGANPFSTLIWASSIGVGVALIMSIAGRILTLQQGIDAMVNGMKAMFMAMVILVLAWGLGGVTEELATGAYLASAISDTLPLVVLPVLVFVTAALISFATGTSWGTMAILFPVVIPLAVAMGAGVGFDGGEHYSILLGVISSVMAGSIFGDHCSPISDTTIMSSMASGCDHIDHVRTQLPYALAVGAVAMLVGDIPTSFGLHPAISLPLGLVILYLLLRFIGRRADDAPAEVRMTAPLA